MTSCTRVSRQIAYKYKHVAKYYHLLYIITACQFKLKPLQYTARRVHILQQTARVQGEREKWRGQITRRGRPCLLSRTVGVFQDGSQGGCTPMPSFVRGMPVLLCFDLTLYPGVHILGYGISVSIDFFFFRFKKIHIPFINSICVSLII